MSGNLGSPTFNLWAHRPDFPNGKRPFEELEPILRSLRRLDPDNPAPLYVGSQFSPRPNSDETGENPELEKWLDIIQSIDRTARIWIEFAFREVALNVGNKKTLTWLEDAASVTDEREISIIAHFIEQGLSEAMDLQKLEVRIEKLKTRIEQLERFRD